MKISKIFLLAIFLSACGITAIAQQTPTPPTKPTAPEPFMMYFGDGNSYLGIYSEEVTRENMSKFNLREVRGVAIEKVVEDSPAAKAGLQAGDVILRFNGEEVTSSRKLTRLVSEVAPDHQVKLTISRNGSERDVTVTLGKRSEMSAKMYEPLLKTQIGKLEGFDKDKLFSTYSFGSYRRIGVSTMQLNKQLAEHFGVGSGKGVLVTEVSENSPAAKAGIKAGDVIIAVDGEEVDQVGDLSRAINKKKEGEITLTVIRNRGQQTIRVTPEEQKGGFLAPESFEFSDKIRAIVTPQIKVTMPKINIAPSILLRRVI